MRRKAECIAIVGGNGSGKTTLGRQLAHALDCVHLDAEDFSFFPSAVPYAEPRPKTEVRERLLAVMNARERFVFSSVGGDFGRGINEKYDLILCLEAPLELRLQRVMKRSLEAFGDRVLPGGDLYEQEQAFFRRIAARDPEKLEAWLKAVNCPVLRLDGSLPTEENVRRILVYLFRDDCSSPSTVGLGDTVRVIVDRPMGSCHPEYPRLCYPVNYGYIPGTLAPDGEEEDAYLLGVDHPVAEFTGQIIAVVCREDDAEHKWVVAPEGAAFSAREIEQAVRFQEQYFVHEICMAEEGEL